MQMIIFLNFIKKIAYKNNLKVISFGIKNRISDIKLIEIKKKT